MMMTTIETTSEKYYNEAIRQLLQHPMIIVCLVQMFSGFMDDFLGLLGAATVAVTTAMTAVTTSGFAL
jgi:hypothetical protein